MAGYWELQQALMNVQQNCGLVLLMQRQPHGSTECNKQGLNSEPLIGNGRRGVGPGVTKVPGRGVWSRGISEPRS